MPTRGSPTNLDELGFLSAVALRLAEESFSEEDVYQLVAEQVSTIAPNSLIVTSRFEPSIDSTVVHACAGPPELLEAARQAMGTDLIGLTFRVNEDARRGISEGKLVHLDGGLRQLVFDAWSLDYARRLEEQLGVRSVHALAFARKGDFLGTTSIISRAPELAHPRLIEAFARLAAVSIQRMRAEAQVRESEQRLRQLADTLVEADRRKDEFLAILSHELRNPLSPIRNSLYILERAEASTDQARRARAIIERQVHHLTRLVDDLLDVTRITRGKIHLQRQLVELNQLVRTTVEDHRSLFVDRGIEIEASLAHDALWVDADTTRIAQVIGNLLLNAAKFTPPGGRATVTVAADPATTQAILQVRDTGVGIAPELLPRVFEPFMQGDTTIERSKGGLGLGLMLAKGLVEMHGGSLSVASEGPGKGAQFTVRLPLQPRPARGAAPAGRDLGGRARVLVIEDNVDALETLRDALELVDNTVAIAHTGPEGVEQARTFHPDVVLCDIGLPGMDGYEVARTIRQIPELRGVGLVALTGYASPDDITQSQRAGFDRHVPKPPTIETLQRIITELRSSSERAAPQPAS